MVRSVSGTRRHIQLTCQVTDLSECKVLLEAWIIDMVSLMLTPQHAYCLEML